MGTVSEPVVVASVLEMPVTLIGRSSDGWVRWSGVGRASIVNMQCLFDDCPADDVEWMGLEFMFAGSILRCPTTTDFDGPTYKGCTVKIGSLTLGQSMPVPW